jgi:uncharacterized membrane protein YhaH (DUF805 family)
MDFLQAVKSCLSMTGYFKFFGRSRRSEYWWFMLFSIFAYSPFLESINTALLNPFLHKYLPYVISSLLIPVIFLTIPSIAVKVRRLHDINFSGWWVLLGLIPIVGNIALLILYIRRGTKGPNRFGEDPLASDRNTDPSSLAPSPGAALPDQP